MTSIKYSGEGPLMLSTLVVWLYYSGTVHLALAVSHCPCICPCNINYVALVQEYEIQLTSKKAPPSRLRSRPCIYTETLIHSSILNIHYNFSSIEGTFLREQPQYGKG